MYRIRIPAVLLALSLVASLHIAQEGESEAPTPDPDVELNGLYKVEGRSWTHRTVKWTRGDAPTVETRTTTVDSVEDDYVKISHTRRYTGGAGGGSSGFPIDRVRDREKGYVDVKLPVETIDAGFREFECRKHRETKDGLQVTTWVSTEYHPLIVKRTEIGPDSTTVQTLTGFISKETDPWLLYRKQGRSWTLSYTMEMQGMDPMVTYSRQTVTEVGEDYALLQHQSLDEDMQPMGGVEPSEMRIEFKAADSETWAETGETVSHERKKVGMGEFDCLCVEYAGTKSWVSSRYPGLMVYMEADSMTGELVEFDLGHDTGKFYRTVGNYYKIKNTTKVGGMEVESAMHYEVTRIEDGKATVTLTTLDPNGRSIGENTLTMPVSEPDEEEEPEPLTPYSGQEEEVITTEAGTFCAIRDVTDTGDMVVTTWTWNGLTVLTETSGDGLEMRQEITEINIE